MTWHHLPCSHHRKGAIVMTTDVVAKAQILAKQIVSSYKDEFKADCLPLDAFYGSSPSFIGRELSAWLGRG